MASNTLRNVSLNPAKQSTPGTERARTEQVKSSQGAFVFQVDKFELARRFLILGSESSYYESGAEVSLKNAKNLQAIAKDSAIDAMKLIDLIVDVSVNGRAPKQSPALFALALVIAETPYQKVKAYGYSKVNDVCRTGSTLFEFTSYVQQLGSIVGSGFHKAVGRWYAERDLDSLAYQMVKYRSRNGFDHSRLLRLSKTVKSKDRPELAPLLDWALGKPSGAQAISDSLPKVVAGFERAKAWENTPGASASQLVQIVRDYGLSWEMLPTSALNDPKVWETLLQEKSVPLGALIRQLPRLTNLGLLPVLGGLTGYVEDRLNDANEIKRARIHPLNALVAMRTYASGRGMRQTWTPVARVVDALERTFYKSFDTIEPTGKRHLLALDLSASMTWDNVAGMPITPREASAAMAMVAMRTERESHIMGFTALGRSWGEYRNGLIDLNITAKTSLNDAIREIQSKPAGGTDLSMPMEYAIEQNLNVDAFVVYTDNELGRGDRHPFQALQAYRDKSGIQSKSIVVAMTTNGFSIADPNDGGMLDVAGFDTAAPSLMAEFVRD